VQLILVKNVILD